MLQLEESHEDVVSVITLRGDIDAYTAPLLRQRIVDLVDDGRVNARGRLTRKRRGMSKPLALC